MITQLSRAVRAAIFLPLARPADVPSSPAYVFSQPDCPHLPALEFVRFAALLRDDEGFPRTYGNWLSRTAQPAGRQALQSVDVGYDEFVHYCSSTGASPSLLMLMACASAKAAGAAQAGSDRKTRRH